MQQLRPGTGRAPALAWPGPRSGQDLPTDPARSLNHPSPRATKGGRGGAVGGRGWRGEGRGWEEQKGTGVGPCELWRREFARSRILRLRHLLSWRLPYIAHFGSIWPGVRFQDLQACDFFRLRTGGHYKGLSVTGFSAQRHIYIHI